MLVLIAAATGAFLAGPIYLLSGWVMSPARPLVCPPLAAVPAPAPRAPISRPTAKPRQSAPRPVSTLGAVGVIVGLAFFLVIWVLASLAVMGLFSLGALLLPALAVGTCLAIAARYVVFFRARFAWIVVGAGVGIVGRAVLLAPSLASCRPLDFSAALIAGIVAGWLMRTLLRVGWRGRDAV